IHVDSFEHPKIRPLCDQLQFPKSLVERIEKGAMPKTMLKKFPVDSPRGAFSWTALEVCMILNNTVAKIIDLRKRATSATSQER
ncbi:MAG TPA: hypothetical protein VFV70_06125, partial [Hyphomonadaceae bacterium]|nr:hypothetical protein [Hyphomonadaceae bacterium]